MAKPRRITVRFGEQEYQALERDAKLRGMNLAEFSRLRLSESAEAFDLAVINLVAHRMAANLEHELRRWQDWWKAHPESGLHVPPPPSSEEEGDA